LKHLRAHKASVTVEAAAKGLIDAKEAAGRSAGYCDDLGWRLAKVTTFFDKRSIGQIAATGNAAQTALKCGHDQAILFAHYRELVRPKEAARFWEIRPSAAGDNLVAFPLEAA
jgi:hypothetical protein